MRARMGLYSADVRCELREVVLRDKPTEMVDISPKATVPVLQLPDGKVIDESLDIMLWALKQHDPADWLNPAGSALNEAIALIGITETDFKPHLDRYKYPNRYGDVSAEEHRDTGSKFIALLEERLTTAPWLFGEKPCIADIAVFPFVRQFANTDRAWFDASPWTRTQAWLAKLIENQLFIAIMKKYPQWHGGDAPVIFPQ